MRKLLYVLSLLLTVTGAIAQTDDKLAARNLVEKNAATIGMEREDLENYLVSSSYFDKSTSTQMVYLVQSYLGLPVYNQMMVLAFKNGQLISKTGQYNRSIEKLVNVKNAMPSVTPELAVISALADKGLAAKGLPVALDRKDNGRKVEYGKLGIARENITAQLMWYPEEKSGQVYLVWEIYFIPQTSSDYWLVRVNAVDNSIMDSDNLTTYCNWDHPAGHSDHTDCKVAINSNSNTNLQTENLFDFKSTTHKQVQAEKSPLIVNGASYRVIPFPAESPIHPGGSPAVVTNPWLSAPGNATTLKWHTGLSGTDYTYTRGNNVWAYEDRLASNAGSVAKSASSTTTPDPLTFDFVPDFNVEPIQTTPVQNQQFNITNLFYWNNVIHDVMYQYGFNEVTGNFQDDNQGRGGAGNDHVNAEAQDGVGTNNANFSTPADGSSGRMQMFLWTAPTPDRDGDVDNGIIVHEYGHGISNRLTGGPAISTCLQNSEQMGEGWSDYYSLMFTQDWASANLNTGFSSPRGIGTYALNQAITGAGIRPARYCTDLAVNNYTYANLPSMAIPHGVGFVWCTILWDMTWNIINQVGTISPNLYDATANGGNIIAMKLVTEGMKLQQCSPGFVSGRNAILQADMNLYGGAYRCAILAAFARRGVGVNASEGSTSSVTDQVVDYTGGSPVLELTQNGVVSVPAGQNITYNNKVVAYCNAISNYTLRDTLPLTVSFVSATNGGTYNAGTRVVSWPVNLAADATGNYAFTVNVNTSAYSPGLNLISETVPAASISADWTAASTTANVWTAHNVRSFSAPNSFFTPDAAVVSDQTLATTNSFALPADPPTLSFRHWYNSESTYDGGVLEISTNGGSTWADIGAANFTQNGYNATLSSSYSNPIGGRQAWSGNSGSFIETKVNMAAYANQPTVKLRWRFGSDVSVAGTGWNVDDILLQKISTISMRTRLFDNTNTSINIDDTIAVITEPVTSTLNLKVFLQGYYSDINTMRANLFDLGLHASSTACDSITVNLWSAESLSNPAPDYSVRALLLTNGNATVEFPGSVNGNAYYIAVKHRNHMETWSKLPVNFASPTSYDFTTAQAQAYDDGVNPPMASMAGSKFAIYGGDVNKDGTVDASDMADVDNDNAAFAFGYNDTDVSGDGATDASDISIVDNNQALFLFYARPY